MTIVKGEAYRRNESLVQAALAKGLEVGGGNDSLVIVKGRERVTVGTWVADDRGRVHHDHLRLSGDDAWPIDRQEAMAFVRSGMSATHIGKSVADLTPAEVKERIGGDRGSATANRYTAYRQRGVPAASALRRTRKDMAARADAADAADAWLDLAKLGSFGVRNTLVAAAKGYRLHGPVKSGPPIEVGKASRERALDEAPSREGSKARPSEAGQDSRRGGSRSLGGVGVSIDRMKAAARSAVATLKLERDRSRDGGRGR